MKILNRLDVEKCEKRRYKKDRDVLVDYINLFDFVQTMKPIAD